MNLLLTKLVFLVGEPKCVINITLNNTVFIQQNLTICAAKRALLSTNSILETKL